MLVLLFMSIVYCSIFVYLSSVSKVHTVMIVRVGLSFDSITVYPYQFSESCLHIHTHVVNKTIVW